MSQIPVTYVGGHTGGQVKCFEQIAVGILSTSTMVDMPYVVQYLYLHTVGTQLSTMLPTTVL